MYNDIFVNNWKLLTLILRKSILSIVLNIDFI